MGLARGLGRLAVAAIAAAALVGVAVAGMYVSTAPEIVSLVLEPVSLLLMPGMMIAVLVAWGHDFSPTVAVMASFGFYCALFFAGLWWRSKRLGFARRGEQ